MSIMHCDNCNKRVDTDYDIMFPFNGDTDICESCFETTLWENDRFLDRVNDLNGWFMESITEQPDAALEKLKDALKTKDFAEAGKLIHGWVEDYCSDGLEES